MVLRACSVISYTSFNINLGDFEISNYRPSYHTDNQTFSSYNKFHHYYHYTFHREQIFLKIFTFDSLFSSGNPNKNKFEIETFYK